MLARALQTQSPALSTLQLLVMLNAVAGAALLSMALLRRLFYWHKPTTPIPRLPWRLSVVVFFFGIVIVFRAVTNVASASFAPAHWCAMINLTTPIFTAAIGRFVFAQPLPAGTVMAVLGGLLGSVLVVFGGGGKDTGANTFPNSEVIFGVVLALISTIALAVYQHFVRETKVSFHHAHR